jgi:hypothetical protein
MGFNSGLKGLKVIINRLQGKKEDDKKLRNYYKEANDHVWKTDNEHIQTTRFGRMFQRW